MSKIRKYDKLRKDVLKFCISKAKTGPQLGGVFHDGDNKVAVSTNGYILAVIPSMYDVLLADKIIGEYQTLSGEFPKWSGVVPSKFDTEVTVFVDSKFIVKSKRTPTPVFIYPDGSLSFDEKEGRKIKINSEFLKPLANGSFKFSCNFDAPLSPIKVNLNDDTNDYMVIMPTR